MSTDVRLFQDWSRVQEKAPGAREGVIVWDPTLGEYKVLWDDNGWQDYLPTEVKKELEPS
jgi:hypothetical protein